MIVKIRDAAGNESEAVWVTDAKIVRERSGHCYVVLDTNEGPRRKDIALGMTITINGRA